MSCAGATARLLGVALIGCLISACDHDTSDAGPRAAAAVVAIALQSDEFKTQREELKARRDARMLPVTLEQRLQPATAAGQPALLELTLHTKLETGVMEVSVAAPPGAIVGGPVRQRFDLATAARPLRIALELVPAGAPRTLQVDVAAGQGASRQARVFRIVLPAAES